MEILTPKVKRYKTELIKHWGQYVDKGLLTAKEVEFIVNGAIVETMCNSRTRKLFREDN